MTTVEKVLGWDTGQSIRIVPELCLLNDDLAHSMPRLGQSGVAQALRARTLVVLDHDIPAGSFDTAFRQKALIDLSKQYDLPFVQAEGIGYTLLCQRYIQPGQVILGWGDHICAVGAVGSLGLQLSDDALSAVLEQGAYTLQVPLLAGLRLVGTLPDGVAPSDGALSLLPSLVELYRDRILLLVDDAGLSLEARMALCQLLHRLGALSALFVDADVAAHFLGKAELVTCDLSAAKAVVVQPSCMTHIQPLAGMEPVRVDACFIGGCLGGHIEQLRRAAAVLRGRRIKRELRLLIGFASNQDFLAAMQEGLIGVFFDCGAQVTNPGCASCRTTSIGVVGDGEVMASTGCYNYPGCCGTQASRVYLASAEAVARAALSGWLQA